MKDFLSLIIGNSINTYPYIADFLESFGLILKDEDYEKSFLSFFDSLNEDTLEEKGVNIVMLKEQFVQFMLAMEQNDEVLDTVESVSIIGGFNKFGEKEDITLEIKKGEVVCIVGPTGSGKSRLLADIEWIAQKDTPTKRQVLINGKVPDKKLRFSIDHKLVAQLSQNMNFVMDLTVEEFVKMHAESRLVEDVDLKVATIIGEANKLAGEKFLPQYTYYIIKWWPIKGTYDSRYRNLKQITYCPYR